MADAFASPPGGGQPSPLAGFCANTVAMIDTALRTVALLPDSAAAQMPLCRGLEVTLEEVADRLGTLTAGECRVRQQEEQIADLAGLLAELAHGRPVAVDGLLALADQFLAEGRECEPLRFLEANPIDVPRLIACHSMTVTRVWRG